jgi:hypothetical protein
VDPDGLLLKAKLLHAFEWLLQHAIAEFLADKVITPDHLEKGAQQEISYFYFQAAMEFSECRKSCWKTQTTCNGYEVRKEDPDCVNSCLAQYGGRTKGLENWK